jgi:hypothetical protein
MRAFALGQGHPAGRRFVHQARNGVDRESLFTSSSHTSERGSMMSAADGARFQGMTFANSNSSTFNIRGPVASSNTNRQMELNGAFLRQGTQPAFQAGFFSVRGPRYIGGGAYLGEKR